ncbi:MAG: DciA family protein [Arenicellales bacterium]
MKHISSYISQSSLKRQPSSDWLTGLWYRTAPPALQKICHPVKYHDDCLTLQVKSSIWLSRIRQQQKSLIRHLRRSREFASLGKIKLEVLPGQVTTPQKQANHFHQKLSDSNKKLLLSSANHLSDPELSQSLVRLAKTASKS